MYLYIEFFGALTTVISRILEQIESRTHPYSTPSLGAHSDVFLFRERPEGETYLCERLIGVHDGIKPVGMPAPLQCETCGSIRPWQVKGKPNGNKGPEKNFVIHLCKWRGCSSRTGPGIQYNLPASVIWVKEPVTTDPSCLLRKQSSARKGYKSCSPSSFRPIP